MPLSTADLAALGETPITIRSTFFSNVYLRMDGTGVPSTEPGGGTVNCQFHAGPVSPTEKYKLRRQADGSFSFESVAYPNAYLRMDGTGVTYTGPGGGTVNCRSNANGGSREKYQLRPQTDGSFSVESVAFPKVFLRMVASGLTSTTANGGGTVNCQFNAEGGGHEKFFLEMADQQLAFAMQRQQQNMWCWAAATVSIAAFYDPATGWTQCSLVNEELGLDNCCGPAGPNFPCNQGRWPDPAIERVGHLNQTLDGALTPVQVGAEMANSAPVGVDVRWAGGGGHIVVVRGRSRRNGVEWVSVSDPWDGDSDVTYDNFVVNYKNFGGAWTHTYKTRR